MADLQALLFLYDYSLLNRSFVNYYLYYRFLILYYQLFLFTQWLYMVLNYLYKNENFEQGSYKI
jgi:hypothetical protein